MRRLSQTIRTVVFFVSFILLFSAMVLADGVTHYTYDAAGNRIGSTHVLVLRQSDDGSEKESTPKQDNLTDHNIKIYPNPTYGHFSVEITGPESLDSISIVIYSMNGSIVYSNDNPESIIDIDITSSPNGIYLLIIAIKDEKSTWKIIKV